MTEVKRAVISELLSIWEFASTSDETRSIILRRVSLLMRITQPSEPWLLDDASISEILKRRNR